MSKFSDDLVLETVRDEVEAHFSGGIGLLSKALIFIWIGEKILAEGEARAREDLFR